MARLILTNAGSRQPFVTVTATTLPTQVACNRLTVQLITPGSTAYFGLQKPLGVADAVSSSINDFVLNDSNPSFTIGPIHDGNAVYLPNIWWDASAGNTAIDISPSTV